MKEQFVPYELAIKLREKGFDELCMAYYNTEDFYNYKGLQKPGEWFSITSTPVKDYNKQSFVIAPLWQQVTEWFREKHNIDFSIELGGKPKMYVVFVKNNWIYENSKDRMLFLYNEARQAAIEHALTLI